MPQELPDALAEVRAALLDPDTLVRAVASGRRRTGTPAWSRVDLRPVQLKTGRHLQLVTRDDSGAAPRTTNHAYPDAAVQTVDRLLAEPFGNWHVQTTTTTVQLRVTKKGQAQVSRKREPATQQTEHDRSARHAIDPGDPLFAVLKAGAAKRRQVDAFLRELGAAVDDAALPDDRPLRVVDLGCGNAYLSFAAYRFLSATRPVRLTGVDVRADSRDRNTRLAAELGWSDQVDFVAGAILDAPVEPPVDVVLALHACDTATDDALAQAVRWGAAVVLASPCCHHHLQAQLERNEAPGAYDLITRHPILRERFGDVLTDALRAGLLGRAGYRVDVVQFVSPEHTARDTMIRAVRTSRPGRAAEVDELLADWGVTPYLKTLLADGAS